MGAPLSELSPYASALHFFGAELRYRRLAAGLSQRRLAQTVITAESMVTKVELAQRFPSADLAMRCDGVLDAGGALIRLHKLVLVERARAEDAADLPVLLSGPEARALRRLLAADIADVPAQVSGLVPDVLDRIDFVLDTTAQTTCGSVTAARRRR